MWTTNYKKKQTNDFIDNMNNLINSYYLLNLIDENMHDEEDFFVELDLVALLRTKRKNKRYFYCQI